MVGRLAVVAAAGLLSGACIPYTSGLIINYKQRLGSSHDFERPALAVLPGLGFPLPALTRSAGESFPLEV